MTDCRAKLAIELHYVITSRVTSSSYRSYPPYTFGLPTLLPELGAFYTQIPSAPENSHTLPLNQAKYSTYYIYAAQPKGRFSNKKKKGRKQKRYDGMNLAQSTVLPSFFSIAPISDKCLIVGRPCGQFHGWSIVPMCRMI